MFGNGSQIETTHRIRFIAKFYLCVVCSFRVVISEPDSKWRQWIFNWISAKLKPPFLTKNAQTKVPVSFIAKRKKKIRKTSRPFSRTWFWIIFPASYVHNQTAGGWQNHSSTTFVHSVHVFLRELHWNFENVLLRLVFIVVWFNEKFEVSND